MAIEKYRVKAKTGNAKFVEYQYVTNLIQFTRFLDRDFPDWRFMNIYDRDDNKTPRACFTKNNRPLFAQLPKGFTQHFEKRPFKGYDKV